MCDIFRFENIIKAIQADQTLALFLDFSERRWELERLDFGFSIWSSLTFFWMLGLTM